MYTLGFFRSAANPRGVSSSSNPRCDGTCRFAQFCDNKCAINATKPQARKPPAPVAPPRTLCCRGELLLASKRRPFCCTLSQNMTFYRMTPYGVLDMVNKDTGGVKGDTSFVLSRKTAG